MDTEEFRTAQLCYLYLEEFFNHCDLKDSNDYSSCIVCKMKYYYHKRSSSSCNSSTVLVNNSTPTRADHNNLSMSPPMNQKMGMAGGLSSSKSILDSSTSFVVNSVDAGTVPIINKSALDSLFYDFPISTNPLYYEQSQHSLPRSNEDLNAHLDFDEDLDFICRDMPPPFSNSGSNLAEKVHTPPSCDNILGGSNKLLSSSSSDRCISEISSITENSLVSGVATLFSSKTGKSSKKGRPTKAEWAMKYDDWKPIGVDCKGFDYNQLAPGTIFEEDSCFLFDPNANKRVNKKKDVPSSSAMRAIVAKVLEFEQRLWPSFPRDMSTFRHMNKERGRIQCEAKCGAEQADCRFMVNFRPISNTTSAKITSCYLNHDCKTGQSIDYASINADQLTGKKRKNNTDLKYVIATNPVLTSYSHGVDLTRNDGMRAKQLMRAVDNNKTGIKLTENQAKTFCQSFTNNNFAYHTRQYAQLPDLYRRLQEEDREGLYVVNILPVSYSIPGLSKEETDDLVMFDYCICIPSAAKNFFTHGNKISVVDGAHMYTKYEGMILTICGKDGEDHVVQLGFALVPQENKFYWQEIFNAIFDYLRDHRMIMSDKAKGI